VETVIHSDNDWATVAYLRVKSAALEPKKITAIGATLFALPIPRLLDENFSDICNELLRLPAIPPTQHPVAAHIEQDYLGFPTSSRCVGDWVGVSNVQVISPLTDITIEDEVVMCFHNLSGIAS
jgi:diphthine-ammonia ligase